MKLNLRCKKCRMMICLLMILVMGIAIFPAKQITAKAKANSVVVTVQPQMMNGDYDKIPLASYSIKNGPKKLTLDLSNVHNTYKKLHLPAKGIYGYGDCDSKITIKGIDSKGKTVGVIKTNGKGFLIDFPKAVKLNIGGKISDLVINFTPIKPIIITDTVRYSPKDIEWISPDGYVRQYFVLPPYTNFTFYSNRIQTSKWSYSQSFEMNNTDPENFSNASRLLTLVVYREPEEYKADPYTGIEFKRMAKVIDNSKVTVYDSKSNNQAKDYETQLLSMMENLKNAGINTFFPKDNWNNKLIIKVQDGIAYTYDDYISINQDYTDLNTYFDYMAHLQLMIYYYERQNNKLSNMQGNLPLAWSNGNAIILSRIAYSEMDIQYEMGYDYYQTDWSFLKEKDIKDFENYYITLYGEDSYTVGYHFSSYLRQKYGDNIIGSILKDFYMLKNIDTYPMDKSEQLIKCIKKATFKGVFQDFVKNYIGK